MKRTREFHERRYVHERVMDAKFISPVARGSLPRTVTKGTVRRNAVEETYKEKLDDLYGSL